MEQNVANENPRRIGFTLPNTCYMLIAGIVFTAFAVIYTAIGLTFLYNGVMAAVQGIIPLAISVYVPGILFFEEVYRIKHGKLSPDPEHWSNYFIRLMARICPAKERCRAISQEIEVIQLDDLDTPEINPADPQVDVRTSDPQLDVQETVLAEAGNVPSGLEGDPMQSISSGDIESELRDLPYSNSSSSGNKLLADPPFSEIAPLSEATSGSLTGPTSPELEPTSPGLELQETWTSDATTEASSRATENAEQKPLDKVLAGSSAEVPLYEVSTPDQGSDTKSKNVELRLRKSPTSSQGGTPDT